MHNTYFKTYRAEAAIPAYAIVKPGSNPGFTIVPAAGPTDKLVGPIDNIPANIGDDTDVAMMGQHSVVLGGPVSYWDPITSDANGNGVLAAPAVGATANIIGRAMKAGVAGDIIPYLGEHGTVRG